VNPDDLTARIRKAEADAIEAVESGRGKNNAQTELLMLYAERRQRLGQPRPVESPSEGEAKGSDSR